MVDRITKMTKLTVAKHKMTEKYSKTDEHRSKDCLSTVATRIN
jgi:hypothetical protein